MGGSTSRAKRSCVCAMNELSLGTAPPVTVARENPDPAEFLLRGAGLFYLATLVALAGRVAITFLIAHALGAAGLGVYTLAFATAQALTMLATNGNDMGLIRFASPAHQTQDRAQLRALLDAALIMGACFALVVTVGMMIGFPALLRASLGAGDAAHVAPWFALAILPNVLSGLLASFGLACGRNVARALPDKVIGTLTQVVLTFLALRLGFGLWGVALAFFANGLVTLAATVLLVWDLYPRDVIASSRRAGARTLFRYAWKLGLANAAGYVLLNAALFVLGYTNTAQAGLYAAASRLTFPGLVFFESFGSVFAPHAARKLGDPSLQQDLQRVTNWMIVCSAPIFIVLFVFAETWMQLLGPEFGAGAPVLRVMAFAQMLNMLTGAASVLVMIANRPGLKVVNTMLAWGTNLALVLLLAPQWGAFGAACAYLVAIVVIDLLEYAQARFLVGLSPWGSTLVKPVLLIGGLTLALFGLTQWFTFSSGYVIALAVLFFVVYCVLMLRVGLPAADAQAVRAVARSFYRGAKL